MDPRRPAIPIDTEIDPDHLLVRSDGTLRNAVLYHYSAEDIGRIREGYCCLKCGESQVGERACRLCSRKKGREIRHQAPFPEHCYLCGFAMKADQAQRFGEEFAGEVWIGPATSLEDEMEIAKDIVEREEWESQQRRSTPQIWVP